MTLKASDFTPIPDVANAWRHKDGTVYIGREGQALASVITEAKASKKPPKPSTSPVDYPLKRWQFKAMVEILGVSQAIEDAISAIPEPMARAVAMARYRESDVYRRNDPLFDQLAPAVGLTGEQIDAAWMQIAIQA